MLNNKAIQARNMKAIKSDLSMALPHSKVTILLADCFWRSQLETL